MITITPEQARIAREVQQNGYAVSTVNALLPDDSCFGAISDLAQSFAGSKLVADRYAAFERGEKLETLKQFLVKYQDKQHFDGNHPLFRFGMLPAIHETACACLGQVLTYYSADLWCVLPGSEGKPREWSQGWHRDPEADRLVKVFLFLEDVTADGGPFEYVAGSHNGGYPEAAHPRRYASQSYVENCIPREAKRRCFAPAGTLVFADTSGLHRGGYTKSKRRLNAIWTYLPEGRPKFTLDSIPAGLTELQRQSLSLN